MTDLDVHSSKLPTSATRPQRRPLLRRLHGTRSALALTSVGALAVAVLAGCGSDDDDTDTDTGGRGGQSATGGRAGAGSGGTSGSAASSGAAGAEGGTDDGPDVGEVIDPNDYDGQEVFRHDTFGSEQYWTNTLRMHEAIQAALTPTMALGLGLKVDADALPAGILETADLEDPATTVALIGLGAVIGVKGKVDAAGTLTEVGITCALCHSSVDDSASDVPGIGTRLDGHANQELDPGAIIALAPGLAGNTEALEVVSSWGPGFYDPRWNQDGLNGPVTIPPIYGLGAVPLATYTGDGGISYWNQYVATTQMGGQGQFYDSRLDAPAVLHTPDLVTPKLPALYAYQASLETPEVDTTGLNAAAVTRGRAVFQGAGQCATCHSGATFTDAAERLHEPAETGMEAMHAERSATGLYRTTPLRALALHAPYFHDGSAETLTDVVEHYDTALELGLTADQRADLAVYLESI